MYVWQIIYQEIIEPEKPKAQPTGLDFYSFCIQNETSDALDAILPQWHVSCTTSNINFNSDEVNSRCWAAGIEMVAANRHSVAHKLADDCILADAQFDNTQNAQTKKR